MHYPFHYIGADVNLVPLAVCNISYILRMRVLDTAKVMLPQVYAATFLREPRRLELKRRRTNTGSYLPA